MISPDGIARLKVAVVGTRGIPGVQGGVERHCAELYPRLAALSFDVTIYGRDAYCSTGIFQGVEVRALPAPRGKGVEALLHTRSAIRAAAEDGADIIHVHSVGPALLVPYAKRVLPEAAVVLTVHAPDYEQQKWGRAASALLKLGERRGVTSADAVVCVSEWMARRMRDEYSVPVTSIPNGPGRISGALEGSGDDDVLRAYGLTRGGYLLHVGRLVPDKRVEDLFQAASLLGGMRVVVAGGASDAPEYEQRLRALAPEGTVFTGEVHEALGALYRGAACSAVPSAVEGLPVTLIEAMTNRVPVVASDIPANAEVLGPLRTELAYPLGDASALAAAIAALMDDPERRERLVDAAAERAGEAFDWEVIAARTAEVFRRAYSTSR